MVASSDLIWLTDRDLSLTLPAAIGGNGAITYSLSPALSNSSGLSFDAATRTLSGRPALSVGTGNYTLTATDADGDTDTLTFRAGVQADAAPAFAANATIANQTWTSHLVITDLVLPAATGGNTLSNSDATAVLAPLAYTLTPALPAGINFDADTRTLSGVPTATATATTYTYRVDDGDSNTLTTDADTLTFSITINATSCTDGKVPVGGSCKTPAEKCTDRGWDKTTGAVCHFGNRGDYAIYDLRNFTGNTINTDSDGLCNITSGAASGIPECTDVFGPNYEFPQIPDPAVRTRYVYNCDPSGTRGLVPATYNAIGAIECTCADPATVPRNAIFGELSNGPRVMLGGQCTMDTSPDFGDASVAPQRYPLNSAIAALILPAATADFDALSYALTPALPAGLSFDAATRTISGTPTAVTSATHYTLVATDSDGDVGNLVFSLETGGAPDVGDAARTAITQQQAVQISAILAASASANAVDAVWGGMGASPNAFDISLDGTSLPGAARTLGQGTATDTDGRTAWLLGTTAGWEYHAAYNASDNSADSLLHRLQSMAAGDIAMNWQAGGSAMRFWARYQSIDLSGNEDEGLKYDGSGTGFYLGADRRINDKMRLGLALSSDSADITLDLDDHGTDDQATRSTTTIYPYMHIDLGGNNQARIMAGIGSGTLDIKSTANNSTASADLSWNMLAASISHHRPMRGQLSARFDGSFQLGNSSMDAATFANGAAVAAADASTSQLAIDAELHYRSDSISPFASLAARKLGGDLSQPLALDLGLGADLQTRPAILRLSITRQLNDTDHKRDSLSLDMATKPNPGGLSASLGSRYDNLSGRPQWQSTVRWQRPAHELSLAASPSDYLLQARLRW